MDSFLGATATFLSKNSVKTWKAMQKGWFPGGYSYISEQEFCKNLESNAKRMVSWGLQQHFLRSVLEKVAGAAATATIFRKSGA